LLIGSGVGLCNGLMVTKLRLPPFIATLGALSMGRGLMYWIAQGRPVTPSLEHPFLALGQGYVGRVPVIVMRALYVAAAIFPSRTSIGRYVCAAGGNEQAARFSGIRVNWVKIVVYIISGFCCAISGLILLACMLSAQPMAGLGYELPVGAACAIGGTSLMGGEGTIRGTLMGAAGASHLLNHVRDGDIIGIGGGTGVDVVVQAITAQRRYDKEPERSPRLRDFRDQDWSNLQIGPVSPLRFQPRALLLDHALVQLLEERRWRS
jgi:ABC-type xylose transport system permease subunit